MNKIYRGLLWLVFVGLLSLGFLTAPVLKAEEFQEELPEGKPAYTSSDVKKYVKEIIPLVEEVTGKKFRKIPKIKLVDRKKISKILQVELVPQLKNLYPDYSKEQLDRVASSQSSAYAKCLLGKYGLIDRQLYLMPKNPEPLFQLAKVDTKHTQSIIKLVIAHELTHALQDQETDLKQLWNIASYDELSAFSATIEGHAVFVQDRVGNALGLEETAIELSRLLSAGAVTYDDPAKEMMNKIIASQFEQIYLGGKKFIEYHYQQGGNERVWEILAKPPVKTAMITRPDTYSPVKETEIKLSSLLEGLEEQLNGEEWKTQNIEIGQMGLRSVYAKIDEPDREAIISQIEHAQAFIAQKTYPPCIVSVSVVMIKDEIFASRYIKLLEDMAQKNVKELESSNLIAIENFSMSDFSGIQADIARQISFEISSNDETESIPSLFVRIFRGKLLVEFYTSNYDMEDETVIKIAELIFSRYEPMGKE